VSAGEGVVAAGGVPRGPWGVAGEPQARWLPLTGPADVARRLAAIGAERTTWFLRQAGRCWGEWPMALLDGVDGATLQPEARRYGVAVAPGRDRLLVAGEQAALRAFGASLSGGPKTARLGHWLLQAEVPQLPGPPPIAVGRYRLSMGWKTYVVGIVNRTPNSFSSEAVGRLPGIEETVQAVWDAYRAGADIVDIGAESSEERDGGGIDPREELSRLLPVCEAVSDAPVVLSVDTRRATVAAAVSRLTDCIVNDVDALQDTALARVVASRGLPIVLMHQRRQEIGAADGDIVEEIRRFFLDSLDRVLRLGVAQQSVILDAGFGFGTSTDEDLRVTRSLGVFRSLGRPLMHAPSRKRAIGQVLAYPETIPERLMGTAALVAVGIAAGADFVRVHDVVEMARVSRMADAVVRPGCWRWIAAP